MKIQLRMYKRFDGDLIALHDLGFPVGKAASRVLEAYAAGKTVRFRIGACRPCNIRKKKTLHLSFVVKSREAEALIRGVRKGYRNQFVKTLLRGSLEHIPVWQYFEDGRLVEEEGRRLEEACASADGAGGAEPETFFPRGSRNSMKKDGKNPEKENRREKDGGKRRGGKKKRGGHASGGPAGKTVKDTDPARAGADVDEDFLRDFESLMP